MIAFLRYNGRHSIYFPGDGRLPRLNPMCSSSHSPSGRRTTTWHEPLWTFRLRQRFFAFAGRQRCGRRSDMFAWNRGDGPAPDTWDWGPDGNRTCSYCGSIHPEDLLKICRLVLTDERYEIEGTTKSYKLYIKQPGVRNASEGAIKFYMQHAPKDPTPEEQRIFAEAVRISNERARARWERRAA